MTDHPPHVLFIAPSAYTLGGLAVWLRYLLPGLRARGWDCTLGLVEGQRWHNAENYLEVNPDIQWIRIPCNSGTEFGRVHALRRAIRKCRANLVVSVNIPDAIVAASHIKAANRPLTLMACHGIQADFFADLKRLCSVLDGVACTNRLACRLAEKLGGIDSDRIFYAPCGTDGQIGREAENCTHLAPRDAAFLAAEREEYIGKFVSAARLGDRPSPASEEFRIAFVGRLEQDQKRVFDLPAILQQTRERNINAKLVVAGGGPDGDALKTEFSRRGLERHVQFLGVLPAAEISSRVLKTCDAFLLTSHWETGPIVIWEAMAAGLPIVSSQYIGAGQEKALVHEENSLLFPPGDCCLAAIHLAKLANNRSFGKQLSTAAFRVYEERYTIRKSVQAWETAIQSVLQRPRTDGSKALPLPARNLRPRIGLRLAETMRRILGRIPIAQDAGDEWPHTLSGYATSNQDFWKQMTAEDYRGMAFNSECHSASATEAVRC